MIRVLIADDQALVRGGFRLILEAQKDIGVVGEAEDGRQALVLARELSPDVVLMDIRMPELDGLEATRQLVADGDAPRVLLKLIARGLSNAEIASALFLSEATVKTHVTHLLAKLDLRDRVQAVVLAYESGLVQAGDEREA
jgi:DNA-binding NarL/FixJ family response regulator